jgi:hypothetical protein
MLEHLKQWCELYVQNVFAEVSWLCPREVQWRNSRAAAGTISIYPRVLTLTLTIPFCALANAQVFGSRRDSEPVQHLRPDYLS